MQIDMFTDFLAYGYLMIVGFVFLVMVLQILAFYIAGKATGSIDDEITTAFTLFGALLLIGTASALVNAIVSIFLSGMLIPAVVAFILYLVAIIFAIIKIYELSIGKAILHLILSMIITVVSVGILIYVGIKVIPKPAPTTDTMEEVGSATNIFGEIELETDSEPDAMMFDELTEEAGDTMEIMEEPEIMMEEHIEESASSGPGLPGTTLQ